VNEEKIKALVYCLETLTERLSGPINIMEVCGTHTVAIHRAGIKQLLGSQTRLISGPGCPVCVTPNEYVDKAVWYSQQPNTVVATFGDMFKVPGSYSSLAESQAQGGKVQLVYSPLEAVELASHNPVRKVVFLGIGFETTAPLIASAIVRARKGGIHNFLVLCGHKTVPEALEVIATHPLLNLQGLILPGHVSCIIGKKPYEFLAEDHNLAGVIAGFEPADILESICLLLRQLAEGRSAVEVQYKRAVSAEGNKQALGIMDEVFHPSDSEWRGLGVIAGSGLKIREKYSEWDAELVCPAQTGKPRQHKGCICGAIITGLKEPDQCPLFGNSCNPEHPIGPCMVSSEGTCGTHFTYQLKGIENENSIHSKLAR
jgi:hydrogenase expression/formation protein HypD